MSERFKELHTYREIIHKALKFGKWKLMYVQSLFELPQYSIRFVLPHLASFCLPYLRALCMIADQFLYVNNMENEK